MTLKLFAFSLAAAIAAAASVAPAGASDRQGIDWGGMDSEVFKRAKAGNKMVLLDLEAKWCHWCHVMDQTTYVNPEVKKLIAERFIAVRVDQDARPDLSNRYKEYGWPATIVFAADGEELLKRAGYIEPEEMVDILKQLAAGKNLIAENGRSAAKKKSGLRGGAVWEELRRKHKDSFDPINAGLRVKRKNIEPGSVEYSIELGIGGDEEEKSRALATLAAARKLIDPVWGGIYQYSTHGNWDNPHYEKIAKSQHRALKLYSLAYRAWGRPEDLAAAEAVARYVETFLASPEGAFHGSQDADVVQGEKSHQFFSLGDAERRKIGIPRVDPHLYARENGLLIEGLAALYAAGGNARHLDAAVRAADWIIAHRRLPGGGFSHGGQVGEPPYLGDTLAMGSACLSLYSTTGDRKWFQCAKGAAEYLVPTFGVPAKPGLITVSYRESAGLAPVRDIDENIDAARFLNLFYQYSGDEKMLAEAKRVLTFLELPENALRYIVNSGILLAESEIRTQPLHVTVVGSKSDAASLELTKEALRYPAVFKRFEWWDKKEGALPRMDVVYPALAKPAAFVCTDRRCSLPIFETAQLAKTIDRIKTQGK